MDMTVFWIKTRKSAKIDRFFEGFKDCWGREKNEFLDCREKKMMKQLE